MDKKIEFMSLNRQVKKHEIDFMEVIKSVIEDNAFSGGKYVDKFEGEFAEYIGTEYCLGLSSGTSALFMAMKALGIGTGDEVIVPANTFIASAWGSYYCGARPVFVDCHPDTWEIDSLKLENAITENTKCIIGVHLYGQPFDFDAVKTIANKYGIPIVEDCAQSHGAKYKGRNTGTLGDIGCFSFYPGKNLGAFGEAGAVVTNNVNYHNMIKAMRQHGSLVRYHHEMDGYNLRMDGIQGAVLSAKLPLLNKWNERRRQIAQKYRNNIKNKHIKLQSVPDYAIPVYHLFEIEVIDAVDFITYMTDQGINCGRHYPIPCHLQKVFSYLGYHKGDLPVAESHAEHCVSLPMFPELEDEEVDYVIDTINAYNPV